MLFVCFDSDALSAKFCRSIFDNSIVIRTPFDKPDLSKYKLSFFKTTMSNIINYPLGLDYVDLYYLFYE
jgi:hypothetical protein